MIQVFALLSLVLCWPTAAEDTAADFDYAIQQQQARIAGLEAEIESQRQSLSADQNLYDSSSAQKDALSQQQLSELRERIAAQEATVAELDRLHRGTVAPFGSVRDNELRDKTAAADQILEDLRREYRQLLLEKNVAIDDGSSARENEIAVAQAAQVELSVQLSDARAELAQLKTERQRLAAEEASREKETQQEESK